VVPFPVSSEPIEKAGPRPALPTVPSAEAWRAMTEEERISFQLQVLDALREAKAQQRAEAAQRQAEEAQRERAAVVGRAVLAVLRVRGIAVGDAERARILEERDTGRLDRWLERAEIAGSLAEVLGE
jgi:hypothetical protein